VAGPHHLDDAIPLSQLPPEEKAQRAGSFGTVAGDYERFRPGPSVEAVEWILPSHVGRVVDLGAGTGALSRILVGRVDEVVAVEPDDRMRSVLTGSLPGVRAVAGRGESMPLPDRWADAVVASSSWHWMDPIPTLREVGRVLVPDGVLGAVWTGPDPEGAFLVEAQKLLARPSGDDAAAGDAAGRSEGSELARLIMSDANRLSPTLEIPEGVPFGQPENHAFTWDIALNADELIGLLGTFSWVITLPDETRQRVVAEARRLLRDLLGVEGEVTVDVTFRSDAWRTRRRDG
jgi:SAM-dependent methyltransferase